MDKSIIVTHKTFFIIYTNQVKLLNLFVFSLNFHLAKTFESLKFGKYAFVINFKRKIKVAGKKI